MVLMWGYWDDRSNCETSFLGYTKMAITFAAGFSGTSDLTRKILVAKNPSCWPAAMFDILKCP